MFMYGWVLCCPPETTKTLLIGYTPIQNKKLKKKKQGRGWLFISPSQRKLSRSPALREMDMPHLHEEYFSSASTWEPLLLTLMRM